MKLGEYNVNDKVLVLMDNLQGKHEWRKAIITEKHHVSANRISGNSHGAYDYVIVKVIRTYYRKLKDLYDGIVWIGEEHEFYYKENTEGVFNEIEINPQ